MMTDHQEQRGDAIQFLALHEIVNLTGYSRSHIYHLVEVGEFPPGVKIGKHARRWTVGEYNAWANSKIAAVVAS